MDEGAGEAGAAGGFKKIEGADCVDVEVIERARCGEIVAGLGQYPFQFSCDCLGLVLSGTTTERTVFICDSVWGLWWNVRIDLGLSFEHLKKEMFWQVKGFEATIWIWV